MIHCNKIGVALSGGTAKSLTHIGVLKALEEENISIDCISGTSGGSLVASAYASGMSISTIESNAKKLTWKKLARLKLSRLGFISSDPIEDYIHLVFNREEFNFSDLKIPCAIPCTDLDSGENRVFTHGDVAKVVRMSCALPHFYMPVEHEGRFYIDGGLSEYLPVNAVRELGADFIIAVNLGAFDEMVCNKPKYFFQVQMQINHLVARQNMALSKQQADYILEPDMTNYKMFDFSRKEELIELGYQFTKSHIDDIKRCYIEKHNPSVEMKQDRGFLSSIKTFASKLSYSQ